MTTLGEQAQRYPLSWPTGWKRTPSYKRRRAPFRTYRAAMTMAGALDRLDRELRLLEATDALLSTNVRLGMRGNPVSDGPTPTDPGAAVYFKLKGKDRCLACDIWDKPADNVTAIAQHIDALRRIERYGVGTLDQAFAGYQALPHTAADWWLVLGISEHATLEEIETAYRERARKLHPDAGGSHDEMAQLNDAREHARAARGAK